MCCPPVLWSVLYVPRAGDRAASGLRSACHSYQATHRYPHSGLTVGDPKQSHLSSLFSDRSADNIIAMLKEAKKTGAEVLLGDTKTAGHALLKPHVVTGVKTDTRLWQRETFRPVLVVAAVDTIDEAVELANATDYSLAAGLWTNDLYNAMNVSRRIHSGS